MNLVDKKEQLVLIKNWSTFFRFLELIIDTIELPTLMLKTKQMGVKNDTSWGGQKKASTILFISTSRDHNETSS